MVRSTAGTTRFWRMVVLSPRVESSLLIHPAAEPYPPLNGTDFTALKADIHAHGLLEPICIYDGKILDGRHRYRACVELGIKPRMRHYEGDSPAAFAWSMNGVRRQLSKSQRAALAVDLLPPLQEEARKRMTAGKKDPIPKSAQGRHRPPAIAEAAALVGIGKTQVQCAKAVKEQSPEEFERIRKGEISVNGAWKKLPRTDNPAPAEPAPNTGRAPRERRAADIQRLAKNGYRASQIAQELGIGLNQIRAVAKASGIVLQEKAMGLIERAVNPRRVVETAVSGLEGYAMNIRMLDIPTLIFDAEDARQWAASLKQSVKSVSRLRLKLMELSHGET